MYVSILYLLKKGNVSSIAFYLAMMTQTQCIAFTINKLYIPSGTIKVPIQNISLSKLVTDHVPEVKFLFGPIEQCSSSFFANFLAHLMLFQSSKSSPSVPEKNHQIVKMKKIIFSLNKLMLSINFLMAKLPKPGLWVLMIHH